MVQGCKISAVTGLKIRMKRLILLATVLLGSAALAFAQVTERNGILEAETVGTTDIVSVTFDDGSRELYRPVNIHWNDDPVFSYRFCKGRYNPATYFRTGADPYIPLTASCLSILCPGLGQVYDGEILRAAGFFYGTIACFSIGTTFLANVQDTRYHISDPQYDYSYSGYDNLSDYATAGTIFILGGVALWIWNICDAAKVAKVKDLYFRDLTGNQSSVDAQIQPSFGLVPQTGRPTAGLSLRLSF